jgi:Rhodopirellula transposase DDE domain/Helix-turn-helix of DDE superfamily endonuclease
MGVSVETVEMLAAKFQVIFPHLDERQRRCLMGAEARVLGHGGIGAVARAAEVRAVTVSLGVDELEAGEEPLGRARRPGGGRKRLVDLDPGLRPALLALVEPDERGDPMSPLRWTTRSTRHLASELTRQGHKVGADTVADVLRAAGFSLQGNTKTIEGKQHPDRDGQFRYINEQVKAHQVIGDPVVSVDTKKKELVGPFANGGGEWRPKGEPEQVRTHDFPDAELGKAIPYGVYDLAGNTGWVSVGTDHDTAAFAVEAIRRWWASTGHHDHPGAGRLLITADCGGSNGNRTRAWKTELARLAVQTGLEIAVCHFPPGTSKWNKIEHRLFSHITMNWRGRPLTSHEVIVNTIAATTTRTGLRVRAELDTSTYEVGIKISDQQMHALPLRRHDWHGDWNYTFHPATSETTANTDGTGSNPERPDHAWLRHPALTGLDPTRWDELIEQLGVARHAQREAALHHRRGGTRRAAAGTGRKAVLTLPDRATITLLYQRFSPPQRTLADLFGVTQQTVNNVIRQTSPLLATIGHTPRPTGIRLKTPAELAHHIADADTQDNANHAG